MTLLFSLVAWVFTLTITVLIAIRFVKLRARLRGKSTNAALSKEYIILLIINLLLSVILLAVIGFSLVRPRLGVEQTSQLSNNLDVYFLVDSSLSMLGTDTGNNKTRLELVQQKMPELSQNLGGARMSLISFNDKATVDVPGTTDISTITSGLKTIVIPNPSDAQGTNFSSGLEAVKKRIESAIKSNSDRAKVVVLVSDGEKVGEGEQNTDKLLNDLKSQLAYAQVLGVGTSQGSKMVYKYEYGGDTTLFGDNGEDAITRIDETNLKNIASKLDGNYTQLKANTNMAELANQIKTKASQSAVGQQSVGADIYWILALLAIILVVIFDLQLYRNLIARNRVGQAK